MTGIVIFAIYCFISGTLFILNQYWILKKDEFEAFFVITRAIECMIGTVFIIIIICMLSSAVNLLRLIVDNNSEEGSDKTVAVLHFLLIIAFTWA